VQQRPRQGACASYATRAVSAYDASAADEVCWYSFALRCGCYATVRRDLIIRWTYSTQKRIGLPEQPVHCEGEGWGMSSYASYCQDQATACARRARLASSPEIVAYCRNLQFRWLRLAAQAQATGGALGCESAPVASLGDTTAATCPVEYGKRAGELIARGARSLHSTLRQKKLAAERCVR
jgi:hypothetical protein